MAVETVALTVKTKYHLLSNTDIADDKLIAVINKPSWFQIGDILILEADNRTNTKSIQVVTRTGANGGNVELIYDGGLGVPTRWWTGNVFGSTAAGCFLALIWQGTYWKELYRSLTYPA